MAKVLLNMSSQPAGTPAGVARFGLELSRRLVEAGSHEYVFRSQWAPGQLPEGIVRGAAIETIPPVVNFLKDFALSTARAPWRYPASEFDLVLNLDALGLAAGGRRRMTIIHDIYYRSMPDMYSTFHKAKAQAIHAAVIGRSDVVVGISDATSGEVRRHFPSSAGKVRTILSDSTMNGIEPGALPAGVDRGNFVLAVANVTPNKNFGVLASAFAAMASDHPGLQLIHVGGDPDETFRSGLAARGMEDRLVRLRGIDDAALVALYDAALCLVVPSLFEGFCLPILEAQRAGCPVVFSNRSATGEIGGSGGIRFDPADVAGLEGILRRVAGDAGLRARMKQDGFANAQRFSWDRSAGLYEEAILEAIGHDGRRASATA